MATTTHNASLGFEDKLWSAADLLRNNMDPAEYKHVVLGLLFLKYISDAFEERRAGAGRGGASSSPRSVWFACWWRCWSPARATSGSSQLAAEFVFPALVDASQPRRDQRPGGRMAARWSGWPTPRPTRSAWPRRRPTASGRC
jgi:hypothetical protein